VPRLTTSLPAPALASTAAPLTTDLRGHHRVAKLLALLVATAALLVPSFDTAANAAHAHYTPRTGVTFNNAIGDHAQRREIFHKIIRSINSSPRGSQIKIFSWNFLTSEGTNVLLAAQKRGVVVRLIMASSNETLIPNPPFQRLQRGLRVGNRHWRKGHHSWARTCDKSCRGAHGVAHAKFYMFSHVGKARDVVMQGSANLTLASTNNQWNDVITTVGNGAVWKFASGIFAQASHDKPVKHPFAEHSFSPKRLGHFRMIFFPMGREAHDPVMNLLDKVRCHGATNTRRHVTVIRIAPDVIRNKRGMELAKKVRALWNQGCDIRIGYTVVGVDVGRLLRSPAGRGPVPMKHLVQDTNGDGIFDNYFHLKVLDIVGNVGGHRSGYVVLNGSANWSGLCSVSDENVGVYWNKALTLKYQQHLDYWLKNFPKSKVIQPTTSRSAAGLTIRQDGPDRLVFGVGKHAIYANGTPYSTTGVNPYAKLDMD
jgi:hypothetical protein